MKQRVFIRILPPYFVHWCAMWVVLLVLLALPGKWTFPPYFRDLMKILYLHTPGFFIVESLTGQWFTRFQTRFNFIERLCLSSMIPTIMYPICFKWTYF